MCFSCENYRKFTVITDVLIQFFLEGFAPFMWIMVRSKLDLSLYHGMSKTY